MKKQMRQQAKQTKERAEYERQLKAQAKFQKSHMELRDQHIFYEELTNASLTAEEADEIINLEIEERAEYEYERQLLIRLMISIIR